MADRAEVVEVRKHCNKNNDDGNTWEAGTALFGAEPATVDWRGCGRAIYL